jgi:two-component system sensor histidine kinase ChiS
VRTPLHGILNLAQMMFEGWGEPNKENIRTLYDVSRRLEELVSNILDLSAIEADQMKLSPSEFDVLEMSHETISQARGIAAGLNKTIKYSFKSDKEFASKVYADRRKLKQVLYNILSNAIKYCGDENEITVSVFDMENPQFFAISIEDRGIGIPEGEEEHIFEAFAESSRTKSLAGGKGLGLALTREIMRMHGGKVWAKNNELKKGATFYVVLSKDGSTIHPDYIAGNDESEEGEKPAKPQEEKRKIIVPSSKNISRKTAQVEVVDSKKIGPKKGRIMIIDDEEIVRNTAAIILQSMGYDTVSAASGPAAFEYLEQNPDVTINLILLDLMMPEMYGITVLEKLKANASLASIPVVIQSGSSDHNELNRALKTGAVSILAKPYSKTEIEQTIGEVLG